MAFTIESIEPIHLTSQEEMHQICQLKVALLNFLENNE